VERKLKIFLDDARVSYQLIPHARTNTAAETAQVTHVQGHEMAKAVIVRIDGELAMVVVPATRQVDLDHLQILTGADMISLANEHDFEDRFPDCEIGAMPPLGTLYGMPVYLSEEIVADEQILFNAGTHTEAVRMSVADYLRLVSPTVHRFSQPGTMVS
jgi:Ala-tRNA(Pro) deacylase